MADNLKNAVYDYLLENCVNPIRWFSEREIADELQVKRSAVREILLFLEGEGVVSKIPQRGYRCIDYSNDDTRALHLLRFALEHSAVMKALTAAQAEDLDAIDRIKQELDRAFEQKDAGAYTIADMQFHTALIKASHDLMMIKLFATMKLALYAKGRNNSVSGELQQRTHRAHNRLYEAFMARDFSAVEEALCDHLGGGNMNSSSAMERLLALSRSR